MGVRQEIDVQSLWAKYEDIAMHFNDLLMRLRTQSLAGVAAISALVGIFAKDGAGTIHLDWIVAQAIFAAMAGFWVAIWCLDLLYYNVLLRGAVSAIYKLETQTKPATAFDGEINMSTLIEAEFREPIWSLKTRRFHGVVIFYGIVFILLVGGFLFARAMAQVTL